ncbi:hypothetical protein CJD36_008970 [Flavipsychrobacter stenotrophus]|uniref:Uncharacterized protein n=1 Tax=Flavipsychrobacter stenotrophus TaxID=2077091 RepID=A0A2S7SYX0_9BACT|nr:hypothetical protein CJD36_008970 [Flavipsychrobacter stenotrophus]
MHYFFKRILLFSDSKIQLDDELNFYHHSINRDKKKWQITGGEASWFNSLSAFGFHSLNVKKHSLHRLDEFSDTIEKCWGIN